jgi:hypothetical protein
MYMQSVPHPTWALLLVCMRMNEAGGSRWDCVVCVWAANLLMTLCDKRAAVIAGQLAMLRFDCICGSMVAGWS